MILFMDGATRTISQMVIIMIYIPMVFVFTLPSTPVYRLMPKKLYPNILVPFFNLHFLKKKKVGKGLPSPRV